MGFLSSLCFIFEVLWTEMWSWCLHLFPPLLPLSFNLIFWLPWERSLQLISQALYCFTFSATYYFQNHKALSCFWSFLFPSELGCSTDTSVMCSLLISVSALAKACEMKMRSQGSLTAYRTPGQHCGFDAEIYVPASTMVCALRLQFWWEFYLWKNYLL